MFEINNFVTAGKFFLVIAGEFIVIFVAVSFIIGILMEYLPPSRIREFLSAIGSFIYGFFPQDLVVRLAGPDKPWSIPIAAGIGVPMYIRAETVIPISAALVGKGLGVGTVLALITGGAGASIPEMVLLGSMFKKKLVFAFALNVFVIAIVAGYLVDLLVY